MPATKPRNLLYKLALPLMAMRTTPPSTPINEIEKVLYNNYAVGAVVQPIVNGELMPPVVYGYARPFDSVTQANTIYRIASITKWVTALGAMVLVQRHLLDLDKDISDYMGYAIRNDLYKDKIITPRHLLSHTSGIIDSALYENALLKGLPLKDLLGQKETYSPNAPGEKFIYSNLAAGMIGSLIERITGEYLGAFMNKAIFTPLGIQAAYLISGINDIDNIADSYKVLGRSRAPAFHAPSRGNIILNECNPEGHYGLGAGNLLISAPDLGKIALLFMHPNDILDREVISQMWQSPVPFGRHAKYMYQGLGMHIIKDDLLSKKGSILAHQGFAYGAANCIMFDLESNNGFVVLNSGASLLRKRHISVLSRDLASLILNDEQDSL